MPTGHYKHTTSWNKGISNTWYNPKGLTAAGWNKGKLKKIFLIFLIQASKREIYLGIKD